MLKTVFRLHMDGFGTVTLDIDDEGDLCIVQDDDEVHIDGRNLNEFAEAIDILRQKASPTATPPAPVPQVAPKPSPRRRGAQP